MYFREYFCSFSSKSYYFYILGVSHLKELSRCGMAHRPGGRFRGGAPSHGKVNVMFKIEPP